MADEIVYYLVESFIVEKNGNNLTFTVQDPLFPSPSDKQFNVDWGKLSDVAPQHSQDVDPAGGPPKKESIPRLALSKEFCVNNKIPTMKSASVQRDKRPEGLSRQVTPEDGWFAIQTPLQVKSIVLTLKNEKTLELTNKHNILFHSLRLDEEGWLAQLAVSKKAAQELVLGNNLPPYVEPEIQPVVEPKAEGSTRARVQTLLRAIADVLD